MRSSFDGFYNWLNQNSVDLKFSFYEFDRVRRVRTVSCSLVYFGTQFMLEEEGILTSLIGVGDGFEESMINLIEKMNGSRIVASENKNVHKRKELCLCTIFTHTINS